MAVAAAAEKFSFVDYSSLWAVVIDQNLHRVVELRRRHLSMYRPQPTNWQTRVQISIHCAVRYGGGGGACDLRLGYFGSHAAHCTRVVKKEKHLLIETQRHCIHKITPPHTSVYFIKILSISVLAYCTNLLLELKIISAISQSQSTLNSYAFFISPYLRFKKVTYERVGFWEDEWGGRCVWHGLNFYLLVTIIFDRLNLDLFSSHITIRLFLDGQHNELRLRLLFQTNKNLCVCVLMIATSYKKIF
jgi:hypothetical protein